MIQTESKYIYRIVVGFDYGNALKYFEALPKKSLRTHEFDNVLSLNEYTNLLKSVNQDEGGVGKFFWETTKINLNDSNDFELYDYFKI